jgi:predicted transcriptional regulator
MNPRDWKPGELLEASGAYWSSCSLHAAVKIELFSRLADDRLTAAEIADRLNGAVRGVEPLLNAMAAFGLLVKTDGTYANSASAQIGRAHV